MNPHTNPVIESRKFSTLAVAYVRAMLNARELRAKRKALIAQCEYDPCCLAEGNSDGTFNGWAYNLRQENLCDTCRQAQEVTPEYHAAANRQGALLRKIKKTVEEVNHD